MRQEHTYFDFPIDGGNLFSSDNILTILTAEPSQIEGIIDLCTYMKRDL